MLQRVDKSSGVGGSLSCCSNEAGTSDSSKVEDVRYDDGDDAECYTDDSQCVNTRVALGDPKGMQKVLPNPSLNR